MGQAVSGVTGFQSLIDLASERLGGRAIAASDDFFAEKENLLKADAPVFVPGKFTERGKWMDGWESRRKREPGHDWCVIALGRPGAIRGVNVDTAHFNGNQPETCTLEGAEMPADTDDRAVLAASVTWTPLIDRSPLKPSSEHLIPALAAITSRRFTHVRLNIFPDGGVARLRIHGRVLPDWKALAAKREPIDLAAAENAGLVVAANDMHFGSRHNLIMPGRAVNMGGGWETRRKRGLTFTAGQPNEHDWCIVQLGHRGIIRSIEVDTNHFKGNFPESCAIDICDAGATATIDAAFNPDAVAWHPLLPRTRLNAHHRHYFESELARGPSGPFPATHARLRIFPDGGISRLRLLGDVVF